MGSSSSITKHSEINVLKAFALWLGKAEEPLKQHSDTQETIQKEIQDDKITTATIITMFNVAIT